MKKPMMPMITKPTTPLMPTKSVKPKQKPKMNRSADVMKRGFHKMGKM